MSEQNELNTDNGLRQMIAVGDVLKLLPVSRSTLHRMVRTGRFPPSHELSPMRIGFFLDEVVEWQENLGFVKSD